MKQRSLLILGGLALLLAVWLGQSKGHATAESTAVESMPNERLTYLYFDPHGQPGRYNPPPAHLGRAPATADIQVNYIGAWTAPAQQAFEYAVSIWEGLLVSAVPIVVNAEYADLGPGILGGAGPWTFHRNFANAPQPNTWYPVAIANARAGADLNGANPEIDSVFSSTFNWYYGTDGNPPPNQVDFVSVVLHELGHGLGFVGIAFYQNSSSASLLGNGSPSVYSRYTQTATGTPLLSLPDGSAQLAGQLTSNSIYFSGPNGDAANGGRIKLYAPNPWQQGSSYSHLDEIFNNTPNALMTYSIGFGQAEHHPGPVTLGMFVDMGWTVYTPPVNQPPVIRLGNQLMAMDSSKSVDVWLYVEDETADNQLILRLLDAGEANAGVELNSGRYLTINPTAGWMGTTNVTIEVEDEGGLTSQATVQVIVVAELLAQYLPLVQR